MRGEVGGGEVAVSLKMSTAVHRSPNKLSRSFSILNLWTEPCSTGRTRCTCSTGWRTKWSTSASWTRSTTSIITSPWMARSTQVIDSFLTWLYRADIDYLIGLCHPWDWLQNTDGEVNLGRRTVANSGIEVGNNGWELKTTSFKIIPLAKYDSKVLKVLSSEIDPAEIRLIR